MSDDKRIFETPRHYRYFKSTNKITPASSEIEPAPESPERTLLAAILNLTIVDICNPTGGFRTPAVKRQAVQWVHDKGTDDWSYRWVCSELDLDPDALLAGILAMRDSGRVLDCRNRPSANAGYGRKKAA